VNAIKQSMQARHAELAPLYASGAVGLTSDGMVSLRDAGAVPLPQRQAVNALVAAENRDRNALYAEIANANGHPSGRPRYAAPSLSAGYSALSRAGGAERRRLVAEVILLLLLLSLSRERGIFTMRDHK